MFDPAAEKEIEDRLDRGGEGVRPLGAASCDPALDLLVGRIPGATVGVVCITALLGFRRIRSVVVA